MELTNRNFFEMLPAAYHEWFFDGNSVNLVAMPLFRIAGSAGGGSLGCTTVGRMCCCVMWTRRPHSL